MDIFIIFIIIAAFFVVISTTKNYIPFINKEGYQNIRKKCNKNRNIYSISNLPNKKNNKLNFIENKQYYYKGDCIWNNSCELKPNNYNFFQYTNKKHIKPSILSCDINISKKIHCKPDKFKKCFINKSCPCQVRNLHKHDLVIKKCISPNYTCETNLKIPKICTHSYNLG